MRWKDLPTSTNIETGRDEGPSGLAQALIPRARSNPFDDPYYNYYLRPKYLAEHPPTPEQTAWTGAHMANIPLTPMADPTMDQSFDPSMLARQKAQPPPTPWWHYWPSGVPGTTLTSMPQQ